MHVYIAEDFPEWDIWHHAYDLGVPGGFLLVFCLFSGIFVGWIVANLFEEHITFHVGWIYYGIWAFIGVWALGSVVTAAVD